MALGFAGGFVLSTLAVLLWDRYRNMFYSAADVKDILGFPLLGEVTRQEIAFQGLSPISQPTIVAEPEPSFVFPGAEISATEAKNEKVADNSNGQSNGTPIPVGGGTSVAIAPEPNPNPDNELELELGASEFLEFTSLFDELYTELSFYYRNPDLRSMVFSSVDRGDGQ